MNSQPNKKIPATRIAYAVSVALTGNYAPTLLAQSQAADLEAVIVTARKREETLLDIPQEIQAIGQQQLERANLNTIEDVSRFVPSLTYNAITPGRGAIYFRGVADDRAHRSAARAAGHAVRVELAGRDAALHHEQAGRDGLVFRREPGRPLS
jgi:outer membrane receptor protein involved in Fe transport